MSRYDTWLEQPYQDSYTKEEAINQLADEICNEPEFNAYSTENIIEAIMEEALFQGDDKLRLTELIENRDMRNLGLFVFGRIFAYWERKALDEAERRYGK